MVAEVNNTPWGEQHCYVLSDASAAVAGRQRRYRSDKMFHVCPFMPMNLVYDWRISAPGEQLNVHMALQEAGPNCARIFDATCASSARP